MNENNEGNYDHDIFFTLELGDDVPKPKVVEKPAEKPKKVEPVVQPK
jgi:hypothetical protein